LAFDGAARLKKELSLLDVYVIALGPMLSSGFFLLPGLAAAKTGPSVVLAYFLAGFLVLPAMLSKAELATAMPRAGGTYYFLDRSLGPMVGTVGGLGTWLVLILKSAFALIGMGAYLALFLNYPVKAVAIGLTLVFIATNVLGAKETSGLQRFLVILVLGLLGAFVLAGLLSVLGHETTEATRSRFSPFLTHGGEGLAATIGLVFISYAGLTKVASVSEEVRDPDRNLPLGMLLALITASAVYVVGIFIMVSVIEPATLHGDLTPVATAGVRIFDWLPAGAALGLVVVPAIAGLAAAGNAGIMAASRYPLAMARDNLVSRRLGYLGRFRTPTLALLATGALMALAIWTLDVVNVAKLASTFQLLIFALVNLAVIVMRESQIEAYDPGFRAPLYPWIQIFGLLAPFLLIAVMGLMPIFFSIGLVAACLGWYFYWARDRVVRDGAVFHWFERLGERRFEGLDPELRGILKEKGLRAQDPFDEVVARAYVVDLEADVSFEEATQRAAALLAHRLPASADQLAEGFMRGTLTGATPVSHGAALPHLRLTEARAPELVLVRSKSGIKVSVGDQFADDRPHGELIRAVFFLVSPEQNPGQHLRLLAGIAGRVDDEDFMDTWLSVSHAHHLKGAILQDERFLSLWVTREAASAPLIGRTLKEVQWPEGTLVALIRRGQEILVPGGDTVLRDGDRLSIVGDPPGIRQIRREYRSLV
jgi:amino acid transporter/mannitol/fructose-specific phosphotransferase system IIA component (Ntr-type)